ncbi:MAG: hypothetical protein Kow0065_20840 [Methylomicrobium sp.]
MAVALAGVLAPIGWVSADIPLESDQGIQGGWKLEYTKSSADAKESIKREDTWTFNSGKVTITNIPREGTYYNQPPVNYVIEDGKLKISLLGRPSRFDEFSLVDLSEKSMTLKGKYGDIYQFKKQ